jgi:hypothetical protein
MKVSQYWLREKLREDTSIIPFRKKREQDL